MCGLAIFHKRFLDARFSPATYKLALGRIVTLDDMQVVDQELHQSLTWMMNNDISDAGLERNFTDEVDNFGSLETVR